MRFESEIISAAAAWRIWVAAIKSQAVGPFAREPIVADRALYIFQPLPGAARRSCAIENGKRSNLQVKSACDKAEHKQRAGPGTARKQRHGYWSCYVECFRCADARYAGQGNPAGGEKARQDLGNERQAADEDCAGNKPEAQRAHTIAPIY